MRTALRSSIVSVLAATLVLTFGTSVRAKETAANDCLVGIENADSQVITTDQSCTDGDSCDADGATNGVCVFRIKGCVNLVEAGCTQRPIKKVRFVAPHSKDKVSLTPISGSTSSVCGAFVDFHVPLKKKGKKAGFRKINASASADVKPAGQNKDSDKIKFTCNPCPSASCVPPTTTTTVTPTTTSSTTTTANAPNTILDFINGTPGGTCGTIKDGTDTLIRNLTCGGLNIGGGASTVLEGPTPDGSTSRYSLDCTGSSCTIGTTSATPAANSADPDCTTTGCNFGTPLPIANGGTSTCVLNTLSAPASGMLDLSTGDMSESIALSSNTFVTGNATQPCPQCSASGSPAAPGHGTCDRGANAGGSCTSTNSQGLTRDCPPGGSDGSAALGSIAVDLTPLTTGTSSKSDAGGLMCSNVGQAANQKGCFGSTACVTITENGSPAGAITPNTPAPTTLASVFCIPSTSSVIVNFAANLPGPGATSLPGTLVVH